MNPDEIAKQLGGTITEEPKDSINPDEIAKSLGGSSSDDPMYDILVGDKPEPKGFIEALTNNSALLDRRQNVNDILQSLSRGEQSTFETGLQIAGQGAAYVTDVAMGGVKKIYEQLPEVTKQGFSKLGHNVLNSLAGQLGIKALSKGAQAYEEWRAKNLRIARDLEAVVNISQILPQVKALEVGGKAALRTVEVAGDVTESAAKVVAKRLTPVSNIDELVGRVTQGTKSEIVKAKNALRIVDTSGIKTYTELRSAVDSTISDFARKQDELLNKFGSIHKLDELSQSVQVGKTTVHQNYVKDALDQLEELYGKTSDPANLARIKELTTKATTEGLTTREVNDVAREYGTKFTKDAFTKTGEPITSINKVAAENTRKGIKETARKVMPNDISRTLDENMSDLFTLQNTSRRMESAVQKLENKIKQRGLLEKIGRTVGRGVDIVSGGTLRGFLTSFLPSNIGNKVMNSLDLERELAKNLKKINQLVETGTDRDILNYVDEVIKSTGQ